MEYQVWGSSLTSMTKNASAMKRVKTTVEQNVSLEEQNLLLAA